MVIIATGGFPHTEVLKAGNDLVVSSWDIISGDVKPGTNVLIFDDAGDHAALQAADVIAKSGARVEIMTPDRTFSPEVMAMNLVPYMRTLQKLNTVFTVTYDLEKVERDGNRLKCTVGSHYGGVHQERLVDQVVVNHGTMPLDELYFELKPHSSNRGEVDYEAFIAGKAADGAIKSGRRISAVPHRRCGGGPRNTHAAIYDALRLVKDL